MGEYAKNSMGQEIRIGTCEEMYYLRADQARKVRPMPGNVDPVRDAAELRFRFPFPDEDATEPGAFKDHDRGLVVEATLPESVEFDHGKIQFHGGPGYLVMLPCPESKEGAALAEREGLHFGKNGWRGGTGNVKIMQQRLVEGRLVLICSCPSCDAKYRLPTMEDAAPVVEGCRTMAKRAERDAERWGARPGDVAVAKQRAAMWLEIARRIEAGYNDLNPWTAAAAAR
jgi:hypothetical protein